MDAPHSICKPLQYPWRIWRLGQDWVIYCREVRGNEYEDEAVCVSLEMFGIKVVPCITRRRVKTSPFVSICHTARETHWSAVYDDRIISKTSAKFHLYVSV